MKIVKRGKVVEDVFKGTCHKCNSVLEADKDELKTEFTQRDGWLGEGTCPVCKNSVFFYPK